MARTVRDDEIKAYEPMIEHHIRKYILKNWQDVPQHRGSGEVSVGATGMSLDDIRQYLRAEVFVAMTKYNPDYRTKEGKSVKESTFVYQHLWKRIGSMMKRLTKRRQGYGVRFSPVEQVLGEEYGNDR